MINRVIIMVLDGFGVGEAPDAKKYGDEGSNTLAGIFNNTTLNIPNMQKMGIYNIDGVNVGEKVQKTIGAYGKNQEQADGKNSPVGHWEMSGYIKHPGFTTYPNAFPKKLIDEFIDKYANKNFVLHCEQGISRSSAIGYYILKRLGYIEELNDKKNSSLFFPNIEVYGLLIGKPYTKDTATELMNELKSLE